MPLLLGQGPLKLVNVVFRWIVATFDCFISPFSLTQENLLLLAGHYANRGWYILIETVKCMWVYTSECIPSGQLLFSRHAWAGRYQDDT